MSGAGAYSKLCRRLVVEFLTSLQWTMLLSQKGKMKSFSWIPAYPHTMVARRRWVFKEDGCRVRGPYPSRRPYSSIWSARSPQEGAGLCPLYHSLPLPSTTKWHIWDWMKYSYQSGDRHWTGKVAWTGKVSALYVFSIWKKKSRKY